MKRRPKPRPRVGDPPTLAQLIEAMNTANAALETATEAVVIAREDVDNAKDELKDALDGGVLATIVAKFRLYLDAVALLQTAETARDNATVAAALATAAVIVRMNQE